MTSTARLYKWAHRHHRGFSTAFDFVPEYTVTLRVDLTVNGVIYSVSRVVAFDEALQAKLTWRPYMARVLHDLRACKQRILK